MNTPTNSQPSTFNTQPVSRFRPKLTLYHANARGTGAAAAFELHPAHDDSEGFIMLKMANQMTVGDRKAATPTFSRFDWEGAIMVKLGFNDLCKMLQVFRGECESIDDGHGLYHATPRGATSIRFRHLIEPVSGYSLEIFRTSRPDQKESSSHILLSMAESLGLSEAIAGSMSIISFGIPMLSEKKEARYVEAG